MITCDVGPQTSVNHEIKAAKGFISFVEALEQVEHLQAEVDDEGVEQVLRNLIEALHLE